MNEDKENAFDEALRRKLSEHSSQVPQGLWDEISKKMSSQSDNRKNYRLLALAILLFLIPIAGLVYTSFTKKEITVAEEVKEYDRQAMSDLEASPSKSEVLGSGTTKEPSSGAIMTSEANESGNHEKFLDQRKDSSMQVSSAERISEGTQDSRNASLVVKERGTQIKTDAPELMNSQNDEPRVERFPTEVVDRNEFLINNTGESHAKEELEGAIEEEESDGQSPEDAELGDSLMLNSGGEPGFSQTPVDSSLVHTRSNENKEALIEGSLDLEMNPDEFRKKWMVEFYTGPSWSYRSFSAESSPELEAHKNNHDRSLISAGYGLSLRREFGQRLGVSLGISWFDCGERYEYTVQNATHSFTNHYRYFSVPLEVDYTLLKLSSFNLQLGAGVQYSLLQDGTSSWVDLASLQPITHSNKGPASPFSENAWAMNMDLGIRYELNDRFDLLLQEQAIFFQESLYKPETGLDQRPYLFNTRVGISVKF